jgi:hypothetical protein
MITFIYKHAILQDKIGRLKLVLDKHPQQQDRNLDIRRPWWNHGNSQYMFDLPDHQNYHVPWQYSRNSDVLGIQSSCASFKVNAWLVTNMHLL